MDKDKRQKVISTLTKFLSSHVDAPELISQSLEQTLHDNSGENYTQYSREFKLLMVLLRKKAADQRAKELLNELGNPSAICAEAGIILQSADENKADKEENKDVETEKEDKKEAVCGEKTTATKKKKKKKKKNFPMKDVGEQIVLKTTRGAAREGCGMGQLVTSAIKEGSTIVRCRPCLAVIFDDFSKIICGFCFKEEAPVWCRKCERFAFCASCHSNDELRAWHTKECEAFQAIPVTAKQGDTSILRILLRLRITSEGKDWAGSSKEHVELLKTLQGNPTEIPENQVQHLVQLTGVPTSTVVNLIYQIRTNAAAIIKTTKVGCALSVQMGYTNHDCAPNTNATIDDQGFICLVANKNIGAKEEMTISYVDTTASYKDRQEALQDHYGFECKCAKCVQDLKEQHKLRIRAMKSARS